MISNAPRSVGPTAADVMTSGEVADLLRTPQSTVEDFARRAAASHIELPGQVLSRQVLCGHVLCGTTTYEPAPADWTRDIDCVRLVLAHWEVPGPGQRFECILPGALPGAVAEIHPKRLTYVRLDGPTPAIGRSWPWLHLAEVHASQIGGQVADLRPKRSSPGGDAIPLMRWTASLACEVGLSRAVTAMCEPPGLTEGERLLSRRFGQLYAINRHHHQPEAGVRDRPLMFAQSFASSWTGLPQHRVKLALGSLRQRDVIRYVGKQRLTNLYVPGDGSQPVVFGPETGPPCPFEHGGPERPGASASTYCLDEP